VVVVLEVLFKVQLLVLEVQVAAVPVQILELLHQERLIEAVVVADQQIQVLLFLAQAVQVL
jgi:hypothetical protein